MTQPAAALLLALVVLASCGGADTADTAGVGISAHDAWVRVAIRPEDAGEPGAPPVNSAAYLVLRNGGVDGDALVAVETELADTAELHRVTLDEGIMRMRPVDSIAIPAGGAAVLEPGGHHVMLIGVRRGLTEGDSVRLGLRLRSGGSLEVVAPVRRSPPSASRR